MSQTLPSRISVRCSCGAKLAVPLSAAGREVKCPKCSLKIPVPALEPQAGASHSSPLTEPSKAAPPPHASSAERVIVSCSCGAKLKVKATDAGKKAKCPKCAGVFVIQVPSKASSVPAAEESEEQEDSLLSMLGEQEQAATTVAPASGGAPGFCPSCGVAMNAGAQLCVACGYSLASGRRLAVDEGRGGALGNLAGNVFGFLGPIARRMGAFMLGCVLSLVGALIGAGIWIGVAMATEYEIGWIAWGVGGLAGLGMAMGYRDRNVKAGLVASVMALFGVVFAKVMVFVLVIMSLAQTYSKAAENDIQAQRELVTQAITEEILSKQKKPLTDRAEDRAYRQANADAVKQVAAMSDDEVRKRWADMDDEGSGEEEEAAAPNASDSKSKSTDVQAPPLPGPTRDSKPSRVAEADEEEMPSISGLFFQAMFGAKDILFILLAIGTAYRVAAGGLTE